MARFLPCVLIFGLAVTAGCDRQQPAISPAKGDTGGPAPATKPPSGDPVTTPGQLGPKTPPVAQQPGVPLQPVTQGPKVEFGEARLSVEDSTSHPVLFFELRAGMSIRLSSIKYDKLGWVDSYEASYQLEKGEEVKLLIRTETPAGGGKAPTHSATANGKPVPRQSDKQLVGFSVKDTGGIVLARSGGAVQLNIQTKFSYDPTGRQEVGEQVFQHEGKAYTIAFSDYRREPSGRLAGYKATVVKAE